MIRVGAGIAGLLIVLGLAVGAAAPATASGPPTSPVPAGGTPIAAPDPDAFEFVEFDAVYELGRDAAGRSTLQTTERLVARFPDFDQNRGLRRELVRVYDGRPTDLRVTSVTDERGEARAFTVEESGDLTVVSIAVPEGQYVHGEQTYVIGYHQRDVTRHFEDTGVDEFYWDLNGTGWGQPFERVRGRIVLDDELAGALTGSMACYRGPAGSDERCEITREGTTLVVNESALGPRENVTVAVAFEPGTFAAKPVPFLQRVPLLLIGGLLAGIGAVVAAVVARMRNARGAQTRRTIIAQYEPPPGLNVAVAARVFGTPGKSMTATLLDLAVRRRIRLLYDEPTKRYGAQRLDATGLADLERPVVAALSESPASDAPVWFDRRSKRLGEAARTLEKSAIAEATAAGLVERPPKRPAVIVVGLLLGGILLILGHAAVLQDEELLSAVVVVGVSVAVWGGLALAFLAAGGHRRTAAGALLHDHLLGLRDYIRLAEADRIRMLQSASGAEVTADRIVQVYERLLPYAVVFGLEREWQEVLQRYYGDTSPDWVGSTGAPLAATMFSVSQLGAAVRTTSSPASSSSSSSGGSSGGGSSGGGGGGGGGGGI